MNKFIENIQRVYPDLIIKNYYVNEIGQNNDVIVVNDSLVFRYPKYNQGIFQLRRENEILNYIEDKVSLPTPVPVYKSFDELEPGKVFTGYHLIEGNPLWRESLLKVKNVEVVRGLASQLSAFLVEMHSISLEKASRELHLEARHPREEMSSLYERIQHKLFPFMSKDAQEKVSQSFVSFLNWVVLSKLDITLIHGDFGASNILWNPGTCEITGVIDFGGCGKGDPAYDFAGILSSYGEEFFKLCIDHYPNGKDIANRVHFYKSTFALQEALHGIEHDDKQAFENGIKDYR